MCASCNHHGVNGLDVNLGRPYLQDTTRHAPRLDQCVPTHIVSGMIVGKEGAEGGRAVEAMPSSLGRPFSPVPFIFFCILPRDPRTSVLCCFGSGSCLSSGELARWSVRCTSSGVLRPRFSTFSTVRALECARGQREGAGAEEVGWRRRATQWTYASSSAPIVAPKA